MTLMMLLAPGPIEYIYESYREFALVLSYTVRQLLDGGELAFTRPDQGENNWISLFAAS